MGLCSSCPFPKYLVSEDMKWINSCLYRLYDGAVHLLHLTTGRSGPVNYFFLNKKKYSLKLFGLEMLQIAEKTDEFFFHTFILFSFK